METSKYVRSYQLLENLKNTTMTLLLYGVIWLEMNQQRKILVGTELQVKHS